MIKASQLRECVIRPALKAIDLWSADAEELLIGTCAQETKGGSYIIQETSKGIYVKGGLGIYQLEEATYDSLWKCQVLPREKLCTAIMKACHFEYPQPFKLENAPPAKELITNLAYATMMSRVFYLDFEEPLPKGTDVEAMGVYWKKYYNTVYGAGTVEQFIKSYHDYVRIK